MIVVVDDFGSGFVDLGCVLVDDFGFGSGFYGFWLNYGSTNVDALKGLFLFGILILLVQKYPYIPMFK